MKGSTLRRAGWAVVVFVAALVALPPRPATAVESLSSTCITSVPVSALDAVRSGASGTGTRTISNPYRLPTPYARAAFGGSPVTINVFLHIVQGPWSRWVESDLTQARIDGLINVLNQSFSGTTGGADTGFRFVLADVTHQLAPPSWEDGVGAGSGNEIQLKSDREGSYADLNIWTQGGFPFGWATMPVTAPDSNAMALDGVVVNELTLPGSSYPDPFPGYGYTEGDTVVHLVGNWLGLYNTFQNGCKAPGDYVDDTPSESTAGFACPEGQDGCTAPGTDPIHNFMDMSSDACRYEFTEGQAARAQAIWHSLRVPPPPTIASFTPTSALPNTTVLIKGSDLFFLKSVAFNGIPASGFGALSATEAVAAVPYGATTGPITVTTDTGVATSAKPFTVIGPAPPVIKHLSPASTYPGAVLVVQGVGFTGATDVSFNGVSVPDPNTGYGWQVVSDTKITVLVPDGVTDGPLTVTTPVGSASAPFTVAPFPVPRISGVLPGGSTVGHGVTIKGSGFYRVSSVKFNGVEAASFAVLTSGLITAAVPDAASTGPVSVIEAGGTAVSRRSFVVFSDGQFEACLGGTRQVHAGTVPYLVLSYSVFRAADAKVFRGATRTTVTVNGLAVGNAAKYWSKTAYEDNPYDQIYWSYIPGVLLGNPGSQMVVTFDVVASRTFSDGIRVHYQGEHVIGPSTCTIVAT
jgi:Pregnancy-associated plasma protein-A